MSLIQYFLLVYAGPATELIQMHSENFEYFDGSSPMEGYIAYDDASDKKRPAVLISHAWGGLGSEEKEIAEKIAALGYLAFALDNYGKGKRGNSMEENSKLMQPFIDDRAMLLKRLQAGLDAAEKHPLVEAGKIAAIGYCFGGLCVLDLARSADPRLCCSVSFHGLFGKPNIGKQEKISAKILILHGYDDPMATPQNLLEIAKELSDAGADWQVHAYGGVVHAFSSPSANMPENGILYNENAARRSWQAMCNFLAENF